MMPNKLLTPNMTVCQPWAATDLLSHLVVSRDAHLSGRVAAAGEKSGYGPFEGSHVQQDSMAPQGLEPQQRCLALRQLAAQSARLQRRQHALHPQH